MDGQRVSIRQVPSYPCVCKVKSFCVYRDEWGSCDEPRINKGNSDAACHKLNNKDLLERLRD